MVELDREVTKYAERDPSRDSKEEEIEIRDSELNSSRMDKFDFTLV
jgi:hypothetical protein